MLSDIILKIAGFNKREEDSKFYPRPSLAGPKRCSRQMVYWGLGFPKKPLSDRFFVVMDDSKWHEELTLDLLRKSAYQVHSEQMKVACPKPMKTGSIDAIVTDILGQDYLLEHKAINHFGFERLWKGEELPEDYLCQMSIYFWGLQEFNPELTKGILLIKNKNTAQYMEYLCQYKKDEDILRILEKTNSMGERQEVKDLEIENIVTNAVDKFKRTLSYIDEKILPKRDYEIDEWQCKYCPYSETCWENYEAEFMDMTENLELSQDLETSLAYYLETDMHIKEMTKENEKIKDTIKQTMKENNARSALTERYSVVLSLITSKRIDKEKIPADILEQCQVKSISERIKIRLRKMEV